MFIFFSLKGTGSFTYTGSIFGQSSGSRFGMSIATLGDINNDGYNGNSYLYNSRHVHLFISL